MTYRKFESLLTGLGFAVILATILGATSGSYGLSPLLGQALMAPVLFIALHWGRRSGQAAALIAALVYIATAVTMSEAGTAQISQDIALRAVSYGAIGIMGGELAYKMKYVLAGIENESFLDQSTKVFDKTYLTRLVHNCISYHSRYSRPFSIVMVSLNHLSPETGAAQPLPQKGMRLAAMILRDNIRIIDELGSWDAGTLCIVAPDTSASDAPAACRRMEHLLEQQMQAYGYDMKEAVRLESFHLTFPHDRARIEGLIGIDPTETKTEKNEELVGAKS